MCYIIHFKFMFKNLKRSKKAAYFCPIGLFPVPPGVVYSLLSVCLTTSQMNLCDFLPNFNLVCLDAAAQLSVKGYNDKQHILLKKIIEKMATFEIDEKRFDIIKEAVSSNPSLKAKLEAELQTVSTQISNF